MSEDAIWTPFEKAAELLAATAEFQTMVSAETAAESLVKVKYPYYEVPETEIPLAVLWKASGMTRTVRKRIGLATGTLMLTLYDLIPEAQRGDPAADYEAWAQRVAAILRQMLELAATSIPDHPTHDWYWNLDEFEEMDPPAWLDQAETGLAHCRVATYRLGWV